MANAVYQCSDSIPKKGKIMVLIRPARRPTWWPKAGNEASWATIDFSPETGYVGFSVGYHPFQTVQAKYVKEALLDFASTQMGEDGKAVRKWVVKLMPVTIHA
jgi:hypothetical protein